METSGTCVWEISVISLSCYLTELSAFWLVGLSLYIPKITNSYKNVSLIQRWVTATKGDKDGSGLSAFQGLHTIEVLISQLWRGWWKVWFFPGTLLLMTHHCAFTEGWDVPNRAWLVFSILLHKTLTAGWDFGTPKMKWMQRRDPWGTESEHRGRAWLTTAGIKQSDGWGQLQIKASRTLGKNFQREDGNTRSSILTKNEVSPWMITRTVLRLARRSDVMVTATQHRRQSRHMHAPLQLLLAYIWASSVLEWCVQTVPVLSWFLSWS